MSSDVGLKLRNIRNIQNYVLNIQTVQKYYFTEALKNCPFCTASKDRRAQCNIINQLSSLKRYEDVYVFPY